MNYPWDTWSRLAADDSWWIFVSRQYADTVHLYGPSNYFRDLDNGITNGYAWYTISGGRQDYMNYFHYCREVTLEMSGEKLLPTTQLQNFWQYNYRSLLNYLEQCTFGVKGMVTEMGTGQPLKAKVFINGHDIDNSFVYSESQTGFYQRLLDQGTYDITFSAPGHYPVTIENVSVSRYNSTTVNVQLDAGTLIADFSASSTTVSIGSSVNFTDESFGSPITWLWEFEGGTPSTSTLQNPQRINYSQTGSYDVSLTVSNSGGSSVTTTKTDYISVNAEFLMNNQTVTTCTGLFYDSGGNSSNYNDDEDFTMTFNPGTLGANVIAEFQMFDVEYNSSCNYDWLKIYNGATTSSPIIGTYCGTNSPGTVEASNVAGALTFQFHSDYSETMQGWKAFINCSSPPLLPVANFKADTTHIHMGDTVHFTDLTTNSPTNWAWTFEGGTPASSSLQNPVITYEESGIFDVTLIVQNQFGSDNKVIQDYITVDSTIGIDELLDNGLTVYPNPVIDGILSISSRQKISEVQVFDFTGKLVFKIQPENKEARISTGSFQKGIYLIKVSNNLGWTATKINILN
jgi:PKD repeat protein